MLETAFPEIPDPRDELAAAAAHPVQQPPPASTAVAKVDLMALALSRFGDWRAGAAALVERYRAVAFDLSTPKGYAELVKAIADVRAPRFAAQNVSKASKSELAGISRAIGAEEAAVTAVLADTEARLVALRDAHDAKVAADKAEAKRLNDERIAAHQAGIATIRSFLGRCQGLPAARIALGIENLAGQVYGDDWQEFHPAAVVAQSETLAAMRILHAQAAEREAEAARLAAQRAEQARIAEQQAAAQRQLEAQAAAMRTEQARIAGLTARIAEIRAAATGHEKSSAAAIYEAMHAVMSLDLSEALYQEFAPIAQAEQRTTLAVLQVLNGAAVAREEEAEAARAAKMAADAAAMLDVSAAAMAAPQSTSVELAQDLCAGLSQALAADPAAPLLAREAAAEIEAAAAPASADPAPIPPLLPEPNMTLGDLNSWLAPLKIDGAGLGLLGFPAAGRRIGAMLYHDTDRPAMVAAMIKHLKWLL